MHHARRGSLARALELSATRPNHQCHRGTSMQLSRIFALALASLAVVACDDDDPSGPQGDIATVRVVNAASGTTDVDVTASGLTSLLADNLAFRGSSAACVSVPANEEQTITFRQGATELAEVDFTFEEGVRYTMVLSTNGTARVVNILEDEETVTAGNRAVRFLNASAAAGEVYLFATGAAPGTPLIANLAVLGAGTGASNWFTRAQDIDEVRFFDVGTGPGGEVQGELALAAPAGRRMQTVIFTEAGTPPGAKAWVVSACP